MITLYDTAARDVVDIKPIGESLSMYTCGPTVYRYAHIGNLRTFLLADLIRRAFEYQGVSVDQIQNITDVGHMTDELFDRGEDRMLVQAGIENRSTEEIAEYYTGYFFHDIDAINIKRARAYPKASEHIEEMVGLIAKLIEKGHAYETDGNVYFDVASFPAYGSLSQNIVDDLQPAHRIDEVDPKKRHHADFLLWKHAGEHRLVRFASPWGDGYPGWHIECSAMSFAYLGEEFDVHTGGADLVFPHHEGEIAQSDAATGKRVVRHWVHGAHLLAEGKKMSKSANNFYDLRDLAKHDVSDPLAFRLLCLQTRYRSQFNFTFDAVVGAGRALDRWRRLIAEWKKSDPTVAGDLKAYESRFLDAINADLDTPSVVALIAEVTSAHDLSPAARAQLLLRWDAFLGLDLGKEAPPEAPLPEGSEELIDAREQARAAKDYAEADRIRDRLSELGVDVEDTREGPKPHTTEN